MRITPIVAALVLASAAASARADAYDCFPTCAAAEPSESLDLCEHALVRQAVRIDVETRPIREVVGIATNPTGFVLKQVDQHVVHIPKWVGFAIDPKGALRAEVLKRARHAARKAAGIDNDCREPDASGIDDYSATI